MRPDVGAARAAGAGRCAKAASGRTKAKTAGSEQEDLLCGLFVDLLMDRSQDGLLSFCAHAGITLPKDGNAWVPAFLAHYQRGKDVEFGHALNDFTTWAPIAGRVRELQAEQRRHG
ncbi:hypothetical protein [Bosea sp. NBC_00550]|uniref:hypothetical protein n=1 Tax=Bosea sp. NBC_00550 TaxID=2969621 RepID=UPI002231541F|nr:hypothetical protein [Bosea sp. NBC_00550]UZF92183.1 hypothetical protein NWE53_24465 [Bosea sp. NBC_00550]